MRRISRPLAGILGTALLLTACGDTAGDPTGSTAASDATATGDPHAGHTDEEHAAATDAATPTTGSTTEQTLAQLRAIDPERLASLHDHGTTDQGTGHHGDEPVDTTHPNGVDPIRIVIPAIGVDADVVDLGLEDTGEMEVPGDFDQAGWFRNGPRPGRVGPAVIAGHVDDKSGPAVFYRLNDLDPGDEIEVHGSDGEIVTFVVREREQHPKNAFPTERVYAGTAGPELRLITCGGDFDDGQGSYRDNLIVFAERVQA